MLGSNLKTIKSKFPYWGLGGFFMRIALLGYGKMGKVIEQIALQRGHEIVAKIDVTNRADLDVLNTSNTDAVIEFTSPESAYKNLQFCMSRALPTVCGSTGWLEHRAEIDGLCQENGGTFFYASNYSIGVNLFFRLNKQLAKLIAPYPQYDVRMTEIHHTQKLDAPSGTAITLAEGLMQELAEKTTWVNEEAGASNEIAIRSLREPNVPGTHTIYYDSDVDSIEITHTAHSREGFALGAVIAAEWIQGKKGILSMDDLLGA
jgi:4-hydroxy-tetrahydrodipicolinate reductase